MMDRNRLTREPIDLADLREVWQSPACGGHVMFVGKVRSRHGGKEVVRLEYEAYTPMAERALREVEREAKQEFHVMVCRIVHRTGVLEPGEISVAVSIASEHRKEAFAACEYVLARLKGRVPIWKKETYGDGTSEWLGGAHVGLG